MLPVVSNVHCIDELICMSSQCFTPPSFLIKFISLFCLLKKVECLLKLVLLYCLENESEICGGIRFCICLVMGQIVLTPFSRL